MQQGTFCVALAHQLMDNDSDTAGTRSGTDIGNGALGVPLRTTPHTWRDAHITLEKPNAKIPTERKRSRLYGAAARCGQRKHITTALLAALEKYRDCHAVRIDTINAAWDGYPDLMPVS